MTYKHLSDAELDRKINEKHIMEDHAKVRSGNASAAAKAFTPSGDRGFHNADIHKAAEELRMEHKGSHDPIYPSSKKNK